QMGTGALDSYFSLHEQKKLRVLAVTGPERDESHKEIPTLTELGFPQVKMDQMTGLFAPPGLPKDRADILIKSLQKAMADPDFKAAASKAKLTLQPLASEDFFNASKAIYATIKALEGVLKAGTSK
ncbi:MAG: tripartite tricarboxylate transporter substrate-binding protein, partial [Dehalococcoidia bacterium]|nr:tripartite tricarboxylate transporter substrate-binding protein [Dehalococcoidia bacterium]